VANKTPTQPSHRHAGVFQLGSSGLREVEQMDRLLIVVAIAVLAHNLQGYALSMAGLRRQEDPHWTQGMSFLRTVLAALQMNAAVAAARLILWLSIPIQALESPALSAEQLGGSTHLIIRRM